jgi:hypothetical protein
MGRDKIKARPWEWTTLDGVRAGDLERGQLLYLQTQRRYAYEVAITDPPSVSSLGYNGVQDRYHLERKHRPYLDIGDSLYGYDYGDDPELFARLTTCHEDAMKVLWERTREWYRSQTGNSWDTNPLRYFPTGAAEPKNTWEWKTADGVAVGDMSESLRLYTITNRSGRPAFSRMNYRGFLDNPCLSDPGIQVMKWHHKDTEKDHGEWCQWVFVNPHRAADAYMTVYEKNMEHSPKMVLGRSPGLASIFARITRSTSKEPSP